MSYRAFWQRRCVPQLPERCLSRKAGIVRCCLNAFAAKSALSAFPFPGKIHPILPAFLITRTSSGTAQKPGDFFSLPAGTAVHFSSNGRTCLPVYAVRSQAARHLHRVFLPQRPRTVDLPLPENSIHAILFQLRLLAQRLLFALTSKPQKDIYYISYKGKLSKKLPKRYK